MANSRIARLRLSRQRISRTKFATPGEVVRWMGAVQCQDLPAGQWAVALRTRRQTQGDIERAIDQKKIVRTWPMRGTLHFVPPADVRWMLKYLAQRTVQRASGRYRQLHLDPATFARSAGILEKRLAGGKYISRQAAYEILERNGISCKGQRGIHILGRLSQDSFLCLGPREGTSTTFVLLEEWIPPARMPERDEAIAGLALKYFTSHGPATIADFAWWSGLTLTEARQALEHIERKLVGENIHGTRYWLSDEYDHRQQSDRQAHLLPAFDEFLVAYKDRSAAIKTERVKRMHPGGGIIHSTVVIGNQILGTWGRTVKGEQCVLHVSPFRNLSNGDKRLVRIAAASYGSFLGKDVDVRWNKED